MPRYVAFLRGVYPTNAKMADLRRAFETCFTEVTTVLGSGNVVFTSASKSETAIARKAEAAMTATLKRSFPTIVRNVTALTAMIDADPYQAFRLSPAAKRVVTFLPADPRKKPSLPIEVDGVRVLSMTDREVFTAYVPGPRGPVFMQIIEKTFGQQVTTRTWDTIRKCAKA